MLFTGSSCSKDRADEPEINSLIGTWKLIEVKIGNGGGKTQWERVEDGYTYTFNGDSSFTSTRFQECSNGSFTITDTHLVLDFSCDGFTAGIESLEGTFVENFELNSKFLILSPDYMNCDEGCSYRFKKVQSVIK